MIIKKLKLLCLAALLGTATLFAGFQNVHCDNEDNLTILNITQGDCLALEAFWDATGQGAGWISEQDASQKWDRVVPAQEWFAITLWDTGGVKWLRPRDNNITGELPAGLVNFSNFQTLDIYGNHFTGEVPQAYHGIESFLVLDISNNNYLTLPAYNTLPINLVGFQTKSNTMLSGSIPSEYALLTKLKTFDLSSSQLSGPLPDLSDMPDLNYFRIPFNRFTFSDIEPQIDNMNKITNINGTLGYSSQADINETGRDIVYFEDTLSITPSLAANPSKHDYYIWKKDYLTIEDSNTYPQEDFSQSRIYVKHNATQADEGCYSYDVNNSRVTLPDTSSTYRYLVLHSSTCIQAVYDHAPVVENLNPSLTTSENIAYTYTSTISDADNETLTVTATGLPSWLTLTYDAESFTLNGTPTFDDAGTYDINLTVTDGKIPVHINYTLTVEENIPTGYTIVGYSYVHTATGTSIAVGSAYYYSFPEVKDNDDISIESTHCDTWRNVYERLTTNGILTTGYFNNCAGDTESPTLSTVYPLGSKATFIEEPNSTVHQPMIMIEIPLTDQTPSVTIGGN